MKFLKITALAVALLSGASMAHAQGRAEGPKATAAEGLPPLDRAGLAPYPEALPSESPRPCLA